MRTFKEFIKIAEEFRYLPKAKMDRKIKDRKEKGEGETKKTQNIKLIRNVLGKNTNLSKSDINKNAKNSQKMLNKRINNDNLTPEKAAHYVDTTVNAAEKQKNIIKARDLKSNKKNPTEQDKLKREYELIKQEAKNKSEIETKRVINARKRLERSYENSLEEEIIFEDNEDALVILNNLQEQCKNFIKKF